MAFPTTGLAPGVYIDEIQVPGPIAGAPTAIAAFVGPALSGPLLEPTLITSKNQFTQTFGSYIEDPLRVYVTHAVYGFFKEGGAQCYFVRVGTGKQAWLALNDQTTAANPTLVVTAIDEGVAGNSITAQVAYPSSPSLGSTSPYNVPGGQVSLTSATAGSAMATVDTAAHASEFDPGDIVYLSDTSSERATVGYVSSNNIYFTTSLVNNYTSAGSIRVADLAPGQQRIRLVSVTGIQVGSYVSITQGATTEYGVVRNVDIINSAITLTNGLTHAYTLTSGGSIAIQTLEFTLTIKSPAGGAETFTNLSMDPRHSQYFANIVNSVAVTVALADPPSPATPPKNIPAVLAATNLTGGAADNLTTLTPLNYQNGIDTLLRVEEVNLLCIPDVASKTFSQASPSNTQAVQAYMIAHCESQVNRFAILDPVWEDTTKAFSPATIMNQRNSISSERGMGSLYYPWIAISNPFGTGQIMVPPSGHMAGVYANNDQTFGVFKAPANEQIVSALDLSRILADSDQGPLNDLAARV